MAQRQKTASSSDVKNTFIMTSVPTMARPVSPTIVMNDTMTINDHQAGSSPTSIGSRLHNSTNIRTISSNRCSTVLSIEKFHFKSIFGYNDSDLDFDDDDDDDYDMDIDFLPDLYGVSSTSDQSTDRPERPSDPVAKYLLSLG